MTKFVIFTLPRTGSTLLSKSLNKHTEIFCDDEIFHFSFRHYFSPHQFRFLKIKFLPKKINYIINYPLIKLRMNNYLDKFFTNSKEEKYTARGFKLMYYQTFYTPGLLSYLKKNNVKIILLLRENILRNALSDMRARSTGIYHHQVNTQERISKGLPKMHVNISSLKNKMDHIIHQNNKLISMIEDMDYLKVSYEDFVDWDNTMNRIATFLNVAEQRVSAGAQKLNPDDLTDMIENFTEVTQWLQQNNFSEFMN